MVKVQAERAKSLLDAGLIAYWEREMRTFEAGIARARKRQRRTR
jgi:hypothetical protein